MQWDDLPFDVPLRFLPETGEYEPAPEARVRAARDLTGKSWFYWPDNVYPPKADGYWFLQNVYARTSGAGRY